MGRSGTGTGTGVGPRTGTGSRTGSGTGTLTGRLRTEARRAAKDIGSIRIPEMVLFALVTAGGGLPISSIGPIPLAHLVLALMCVVGLTRRPQRALGNLQLLAPLFVIALFYIGMVSLFADPTEFAAEWETRLLRISAVLVMALMFGSGRLDARSATFGAFLVTVINVPLFYAGLVQDNYGGYLTGLIGDKNVAGLTYAIVGLLMLGVVRTKVGVAAVIAFSVPTMWLTGSRTSIAAFIAGIVWILLAPRLPVAGKWVLGAVTAFIVNLLAEDYSQVGVFSDRDGSDELRARIDAASEIKVGESGFFGQGLGEAYVVLEDRTWFFHNSYWSALVEGGWPWLVFAVAVTVLVMIRPFAGRVPRDQYVVQAAGVALLICSTRLGEVFFTSVWGLVLGVAVYRLSTPLGGEAESAGTRPPSRSTSSAEGAS